MAQRFGERGERRQIGRRPRRLLDAATQEEPRQADEQPEHEGNAPAPRRQRIGRQQGGEDGARRRAQQHADRDRARGDGARDATPSGRGLLGQEDEGRGAFPADRQALDHAQEREQDRRSQPQRCVARQDADQEVGYFLPLALEKSLKIAHLLELIIDAYSKK